MPVTVVDIVGLLANGGRLIRDGNVAGACERDCCMGTPVLFPGLVTKVVGGRPDGFCGLKSGEGMGGICHILARRLWSLVYVKEKSVLEAPDIFQVTEGRVGQVGEGKKK